VKVVDYRIVSDLKTEVGRPTGGSNPSSSVIS